MTRTPPPGASDRPAPADDPAGDAVAGEAPRARLKKAPNAFRTISEVADELHIPQHVLRFWETRFPMVRPLKRGGGRRYYRPDDIALLRRISDLLYIQGYTIKGVQRLLREGGGRLSDDIPPATEAERAEAAAERTRVPEEAEAEAAVAAPGGGAAASPGAVDRAARRERLVRVLRELEAVRRLLP
ncbi:MAG: MerR family transcriptional regulator [Janthinobacterium lividum]